MKPRRLAFAGAELEEPLKQVHFIKLLAPPKLLSKGAHRQLRCGFARLLEIAWSVGGISLKHSVEASTRRKAKPYQSAMSMLNFYINRAGANLSEKQKIVLFRTKGELR